MKDSTRKKIIVWFWCLLLFPILSVIGLLTAVWFGADIPSFAELEHPNNNLATQLISSDGEVISTFHIENRTYVQYEDISPNVINAAVATEDSRFYSHCGIDFTSLARVLFRTVLMGDSSQGGGSTITQQLAKTLYPRQEVSSKFQMVWIKLREWATAVKLERSYTKNEILSMYLNSVFFGIRHQGGLPDLLLQAAFRAQCPGGGHADRHHQQADPLQPGAPLRPVQVTQRPGYQPNA